MNKHYEDIRLKDLRILLDLAETLHFGKTSRNLNLSPSTISRSVARIEFLTEFKVFERTSRTAEITAEGAAFINIAERFIDLIDGKDHDQINEIIELRRQLIECESKLKAIKAIL